MDELSFNFLDKHTDLIPHIIEYLKFRDICSMRLISAVFYKHSERLWPMILDRDFGKKPSAFHQYISTDREHCYSCYSHRPAPISWIKNREFLLRDLDDDPSVYSASTTEIMKLYADDVDVLAVMIRRHQYSYKKLPLKHKSNPRLALEGIFSSFLEDTDIPSELHSNKYIKCAFFCIHRSLTALLDNVDPSDLLYVLTTYTLHRISILPLYEALPQRFKEYRPLALTCYEKDKFCIYKFPVSIKDEKLMLQVLTDDQKHAYYLPDKLKGDKQFAQKLIECKLLFVLQFMNNNIKRKLCKGAPDKRICQQTYARCKRFAKYTVHTPEGTPVYLCGYHLTCK